MKREREAILAKSRPAVSVVDHGQEELVALLRDKLASHPHVVAAYLFGSVASGKAGAWSDLDVIIVAETATPFIERPRAFWDLLDLGFAMDILVYTPAEFAEVRASGTGFWKDFAEHHIKLV